MVSFPSIQCITKTNVLIENKILEERLTAKIETELPTLGITEGLNDNVAVRYSVPPEEAELIIAVELVNWRASGIIKHQRIMTDCLMALMRKTCEGISNCDRWRY